MISRHWQYCCEESRKGEISAAWRYPDTPGISGIMRGGRHVKRGSRSVTKGFGYIIASMAGKAVRCYMQAGESSRKMRSYGKYKEFGIETTSGNIFIVGPDGNAKIRTALRDAGMTGGDVSVSIVEVVDENTIKVESVQILQRLQGL